MPASMIARAMYSNGIVKSKRQIEVSASLGVVCWLGLIVFPLSWLAILGAVPAIGCVLSHVVYTAVFGTTICPVCAIRDSCPGGRLSGKVMKRGKEDFK